MRALLPVAFALSAACTGPKCGLDTDVSRLKLVDWHTNATGLSADLHGIHLAVGHGFAVGDAGAAAFTDDGGETWSTANPGTTADLLGTWRFDDGTAFVVGSGGTFLTTGGDDANASFQAVNAGQGTTDLRAIAFAVGLAGAAPPPIGLVGGPGLALATTDEGAHWTPVDVGDAAIRAVAVSEDGATRWAVGDSGLALRLTDAGVTPVDVGTTGALVAVAAIDANRAFFAGADGFLVGTTDGSTFAALADPGEPVTSLAVVYDSLLATGASGGVYRSEDLGQHWIALDPSGVAGLGGISTFEDHSMPNTQVAAVGAGGAVVIYGTRFAQDTAGTAWDTGCGP